MDLYLKNDQENSFHTVMASLTMCCGYNAIQAEQAAIIAHHKGEYKIKSGDYLTLEEIRNNLEMFNLNVELR